MTAAIFVRLALVLGVLRTLAIVYSPMERRMVASFRESETRNEKFGAADGEKNIRPGMGRSRSAPIGSAPGSAI